MSRQSAGIHTQSLLTPTVCNYYLLYSNHLETYESLVKSASHLGKVQKAILNSHHRGDYFLGCMNIVVLLSCNQKAECPFALRKDRPDTRLFTPNPCAMELLRYQGLQLPLGQLEGRMPRSHGFGHSPTLPPSRRR